MTIIELRQAIENKKTNSAWERGVKEYALELLENLKTMPTSRKDLLNGAENWKEYSYAGCSLCYDSDIAERLCSPSILKKNKNGENRPNRNEEWLDVQARALARASGLIMGVIRANKI